MMRLNQVLATCSISLDEIRNRIQTKTVDAEVEPEIKRLECGRLHFRVVVVEIRLMIKEAVPVVGFCDWIVCPVTHLIIFENDACLTVFGRVIRPDVKVSPWIAFGSAPRLLKPDMLIACVIEHQLGNNPQARIVSRVQKLFKILQRAVRRINRIVIRNIISIIPQRRRIKGQKPDRRYAQIFQVVQLTEKPLKIANTIMVRVTERLDMKLIDNCLFEPEGYGWLGDLRGRGVCCLNL